MTDKDPSELTRFIEAEFQSISENNLCEHRPTTKREFDMAEEYIRKLYGRGLELLEEIGSEDLGRCLKMYNLENDYGSHHLIKTKVSETWVIVPRYAKIIEKMRRLRNAII